MRIAFRPWLLAACAAAGFGCTDGTPSTQVITGRVTAPGALAVRAVSGDTVVTAGRVRTDGSFTLSLPAGSRYRLEVLTSTGVQNVVGPRAGSLVDLAFSVCQPTDPFDMGGIGEPTIGCDPNDPNAMCVPPCDPMDPNSKCEPPPCDPMDPNCWGEPPCDPTDPNCWTEPTCQPGEPNCECDVMSGKCWPVPPPCDPNDPMCSQPCDPGTPNCAPPCDPSDPMCCANGSCEPLPCTDMNDPNCWGEPPCDPTDPNCSKMCEWGVEVDGTCACDPTVEANCPTPPPPCDDPMDPSSCKDPCVDDPAFCGCATDGLNNEMSCWPPPDPCADNDGTTCPLDGTLTPQYPPGDFGCAGVMD